MKGFGFRFGSKSESRGDTDEKDGRHRLSRRALLVGLGAGAVVGAAGESLLKDQEVGKKAFFESGDSIPNPVMPVSIKGWRLHFDTRRMSGGGSFTFKLVNPDLGIEPTVGSFFTTNASRDDKTGIASMHAIPPSSGEFVYLHLTEDDGSDEKKIIKSEVYPIRLQYYADPKGESDFFEHTYSEKDLGPTLLRDIHAQSNIFSQFINCPAYILDVPGERGAMAKPALNRVEIGADPFTNPNFENEGFIKLFHERVHMVREHIRGHERQQKEFADFEHAYEQLVTAAGFTLPMPSFGLFGPSAEVENSLFRVFDESLYVAQSEPDPKKRKQDHPSGYGHPYNNSDELLASATTVLHFFPDQFFLEYAKLTDEEKGVVQEVVRSALGAFRSVNSDPKALEGLLPAYARIADLIA